MFLSLCLLALSMLLLSGCSAPEASKRTALQQPEPPKSAPSAAADPNKEPTKTFTLDELAQYDGTDGKPAYIALNGIVYDVTNAKAWRDGVHFPASRERIAGKDLTEGMKKAPPSHLKEGFMDGIPVVGKLVTK